ncbi:MULTISPECIES: LysR family transcriptional regulator [Pantoea]|jgi:DNA-binding transcriptional LysR family regulator|uniref:LysR family transcriptional regulator n=3 Tax=Pantoea TaxID=53335 RepID=A0AAU7TZ61_9GAMM|nr:MULTISPECIES: LysR family transcriptional regulator [Pantoea]MBD9645475.1 LysR family transcriptional regulator [Pantoea sp. PNT02]MDR6351415.1 DNA-binding transcriptional LysR family regulator [Pantoea sp. SORGH_AS_0659]PLR24049.1 LysR family transcriptional regulator [Pantoea endophytica]QCP58782.1 LysR family transcriptional regulator [Pantoea sp. SO10]WFL68476.1 LysR family transcriptional regulator [Pantoea sp. X85]
MKYSPESLEAFVQTVASGSFSAAARALSKSQSTISNAIANLEDDLGFTLFDRSGRNPVLTEHGQRAFAQVQQILAASQRLDELAVRLSQGVEPRLSLAISDFWQADHHENLLNRFEVRYPDIDFECMIAEDADALDLIQAGRVHLGVVRAQPQLPPDLAVARLQVGAQMAIYLHQDHALSQAQQVSEGQLGELRHLRLNTWVQNRDPLPAGRVWSAPSYLLLLEMAEQGFGWSILPRWLVEQFGHQVLKELPVPGWPQHIAVDVVWSRRNPPGPAGRWMIDQLCAQQPD